MNEREKVIKGLESLRDICNAKSNMAIGKGKVAWAGYANTADDAIVLLKEQGKKKFFVDSDGKITPLPDVVRCKDCNKKGKSVYRADGAEYIVCWNQGIGIQHPIDWFCADGRREEEEK